MAYSIIVFIDYYADMNIRYKYVLDGIQDAASNRKIPVRIFYSIEDLLKALSGERRKFVIAIAESMMRSEQLLRVFNENGVHPIFFNMPFLNNIFSYSSILSDYFLASYKLTMAILSEAPKPSVFVGYNRDSFPDNSRLSGFLKAVEELGVQYKMYPNDNSVQHCLDETTEELGNYKNIICITDAIAVPLIKNMKAKDIDPGNFNIASLGSMKIGELCKPSITSIARDFSSEGMAAVDAFMLLVKKKYVQNLFVYSECRIIFRESTKIKNISLQFMPKQELKGTLVDYYGDDIIVDIDIIERMLINCDSLDINIINSMIKGYTYEKISEINHMAVNTIKYRIKKMENYLNVKSRKEFLEYLKKYDIVL